MIPFSVLDLSIITQGGSPALSFQRSLDLAQHVEKWGYNRFWLAEHHGMPGIASAATSVLIGYIAAGTSTIRVGSGGVMLPNHAPLAIAEQFGTLASIYPNRIDLGVGRAPGSDSVASRAMRRNLMVSSEEFPQSVAELLDYFSKEPQQPVLAVPGYGLEVPIWILGSSLFGAQLAAAFGLPYAFASHFAPQMLMRAIDVYREQFQPSAYLDKPYVMVGYNIFAADTDEEAHFLASSAQQSHVNMRMGKPGQLPPPIKDFYKNADPQIQALIDSIYACSAIGSHESVKQQIKDFIEKTKVDELIMTSAIYDHSARLHSYEIGSEIHRELERESLKFE